MMFIKALIFGLMEFIGYMLLIFLTIGLFILSGHYFPNFTLVVVRIILGLFAFTWIFYLVWGRYLKYIERSD